MAGRARSSANAVRCPASRADGIVCGHVVPGGWDYCVVHAERRGAEILRENPDRVEVTVSIPRLLTPLGGISRSEWEALRLAMCGITLPPKGKSDVARTHRERGEQLETDDHNSESAVR